MSLIQQAAAGKRSALNTLYENHNRQVYFLAKQLLRNEKEAAEVFRTVFCGSLRRCLQPKKNFLPV